MCGIAGIVGKFERDEVATALERMLNAQLHRGPDDGGLAVIDVGDCKVALGNRRLAIQDISPLGHQPMTNPETGDTLVYNGEIYNSPELSQSLRSQGLSFRGHSDTEVLLKAYQQWGIGCLKRLKGMYAFALWDAAKRHLILARDHLGIKPLYYSLLPNGGLICASEIRALLASKLNSFEVDPAALAGYLAYGAVQEPLTILKNVFSLPSGSWIRLDASGEIKARDLYWQIPEPAASSSRSLKELVDEGRSLLQSSVKGHLLSDVPVGVFLSSGLDSTAVLKLAYEVSSNKLHAFTVSTPETAETDEAPIAKQTAQELGVLHQVYPVDLSTALRWTQDGISRLDQPSMDGLNTYIVSRAVHDAGFKVALSGQGGDEIFGGYRSFRAVPSWYRRLTWFRRLPRPVQNGLLKLGKSQLSGVARGKVEDIARNGIGMSGLYFQSRRLLSDVSIAALGLHPRKLDLTNTYHVPELDFHEQTGLKDPVAMVARLESIFYLGNTLLRDGDVMGMANSLEIRVPMLDKDLVEWAFRIPGETLLPKGAPNKFLLRQICADFYSPAQSRQSKLGFNLPISSWLLGPLRDVMDDSLERVKNSGLVEPDGVQQVKDAFLREPQSSAWSRVWGLVTLGQWLRSNSSVVSNN